MRCVEAHTPLVNGSKDRKDNVVRTTKRLSKAELDEMIEEAPIDAYGESERITAFYAIHFCRRRLLSFAT